MQDGLKKAVEVPLEAMRIADRCWDAMVEMAPGQVPVMLSLDELRSAVVAGRVPAFARASPDHGATWSYAWRVAGLPPPAQQQVSSPSQVTSLAPSAQGTASAPAAETPAQPPARPHILPAVETGFARLLRAGGISAPLVARMQNNAVWQSWQSLPPAEAFTQVGMSLRDQWQVRGPRPLGQRAAFIGSPGAGKTTALCKQLASDTHRLTSLICPLNSDIMGLSSHQF